MKVVAIVVAEMEKYKVDLIGININAYYVISLVKYRKVFIITF